MPFFSHNTRVFVYLTEMLSTKFCGMSIAIDSGMLRRQPNLTMEKTSNAFSLYACSINCHAKKLVNDGWRIFVTKQSRGRCYYRQKIVTVPNWAFNRGMPYALHYLCHEIAHAISGCNEGHSANWLKTLQVICHCGNCLDNERHYKPRAVRQVVNGAGRNLTLDNAKGL